MHIKKYFGFIYNATDPPMKIITQDKVDRALIRIVFLQIGNQ